MSRKTGRPSYLLAPPARTSRPTTRLLLGAAAVALSAGLLGGLIGYSVGRPSQAEAGIAQLQEAEAERDVQQIIELTDLAHRTGGELSPILAAIRQASDAGRPPEAAQVRQWQQTMRKLTEQFADPPSGTTATNVARGGLRSAVAQAALAVDALALPAAATGTGEQLALVARQAALAVTMWSVAATQLDQINIDAGQGHQHVHLDTGGADGAFAPDGTPEGHND
ncbi:hypothetical protein E0H26_00050 [Micromonospora zingiberis]|uniref:Uncharacterized protein n=1 Tax=Micromonospora zingiberis TaxID=2053011 RepID=A0A4R0GU01_9ACTN|nr:hypothetical protein [Micromonospora zingiberis]TCC00144.1 hypothetical protein E0H26_00050 [Micromonospora zingiberis]